MAAPKIGTHNGTFHCDEVLACFMLKLLPEYKNAEIVRSRDPAILAQCDVVVDVGGTYNHEQRRYDHHQRGFEETMNSVRPEKPFNTIKLSSAGLVYAHYGEEVIKSILSPETLPEKQAEQIYNNVYERFIMELDAIDNGVTMFEGTAKYSIRTGLSSRVGGLNPAWNAADQDERKGFDAAMALAGGELVDKVKFYVNVWLPARTIVASAVAERSMESEEGSQIITLNTFCPWAAHMYEIEEELKLDPKIKYAIFQDKNGTWRVRAVNDTDASFGLRLPLPEAWRGFRDEELSAVSGIPDCIFVHMTGFIGGNKTREGAYQMAVTSLQMAKSKAEQSPQAAQN